MNEPIETLGDALPKEIERVRGIMKVYETIPPENGGPAIFMMKRDIAAAQQATMQGDVVGMIRAYKELKGYSL